MIPEKLWHNIHLNCFNLSGNFTAMCSNKGPISPSTMDHTDSEPGVISTISLEMDSQNFLTPTSARTSSSSSSKKEMSSSLRERLRKSSRYFTSPLATPRGTKTARMSNDKSPNASQDAHSSVTALRLDSGALFHNSDSVGVLEITSSAQQGQLLHTAEQTRSSENDGELKTFNKSFEKHPALEGEEINLAFEATTDLPTAKADSKSSDLFSVSQVEFLKKEKFQLLNRLAQKEETLRKLNMVKLYRTKNNLSQLEQLINRWRQVCQTAIQDLHETLTQPRPPMFDLLTHLQIEPSKVGYNAEEDCFD